MDEKSCDHTSVGMIVSRGNKVLLIERRKQPYGFAAPAGHVDDDSTYEAAAERELMEEVGLRADSLKLVSEKEVANPCRRQNGDWHHWKIYEVSTEGEVLPSEQETKQARWVSPDELENLADITRSYLAHQITDEEWQNNPGLEVVWYEHFKATGRIK